MKETIWFPIAFGLFILACLFVISYVATQYWIAGSVKVEHKMSDPIYIATTTERIVYKATTTPCEPEIREISYPVYIKDDCPIIPECKEKDLEQAYNDYKLQCERDITELNNSLNICANQGKTP